MWWIIFFCGLLPTLVTSYNVFDPKQALIQLTKFPSEYKKLYWFEYPECKNITSEPETFMFSRPLETFINNCKDKKKSKKCFCRVPVMRKKIQYDVPNCKQYGAYPLGKCNTFTLCAGTVMFMMLCGAGTVFNPKNKACDHPDRVKCPIQNTKGTMPPCEFFYLKLGKFPDINSGCKSYFECQFGIIGRRECKEGLIFDTWTHRCKDPKKSLCGCNIEKPAKC